VYKNIVWKILFLLRSYIIIVNFISIKVEEIMWIDNIKMDLLEIGVNVVDCIGLAQDRNRWRALVNSVMNLRVP
jgi:hypothetical protein